MFVVGVTGGIGSGKSAVTDIFQRLGSTIVDADLCSRVVVEPGKPALMEIADHFGKKLITKNGNLDRAKLREIIFKEPEQRQWLEALLHPLIAEEIARQIANAKPPYAILSSPLLLETSQQDFVDRILVVDVSETTQLERTMSRDNNSEKQIKAIMAAQASRKTRISHADDVINNEGTIEELGEKIQTLHEKYLKLAAEKSAQ